MKVSQKVAEYFQICYFFRKSQFFGNDRIIIKRLGADHAVLSSDSEQMAQLSRKLHLIIDMVSAKHDVIIYISEFTTS